MPLHVLVRHASGRCEGVLSRHPHVVDGALRRTPKRLSLLREVGAGFLIGDGASDGRFEVGRGDDDESHTDALVPLRIRPAQLLLADDHFGDDLLEQLGRPQLVAHPRFKGLRGDAQGARKLEVELRQESVALLELRMPADGRGDLLVADPLGPPGFFFQDQPLPGLLAQGLLKAHRDAPESGLELHPEKAGLLLEDVPRDLASKDLAGRSAGSMRGAEGPGVEEQDEGQDKDEHEQPEDDHLAFFQPQQLAEHAGIVTHLSSRRKRASTRAGGGQV